MGQLKWQTNQKPTDSHAFIRAFYPAGFSFPLHTHDFYEVSVIESGSGFHHCNGKEYALRESDILFVHPHDEHALRAEPNSPIHFINIALPPAIVEGLQARYRTQAPGPWPWQRGSGEKLIRLEPDDRAWLASWCRELEQSVLRDDELAIELFLIDFWRRAARSRAGAKRVVTPSWLSEALEALEDPRLLSEGIPALVRMTDRCREHLGRLMLKHYGCTTVEYLARRRMAYAARQLLGSSSRAINDIAKNCGYTSASHFHAKFRAFYHCTPEQYRRNGNASPSVA